MKGQIVRFSVYVGVLILCALTVCMINLGGSHANAGEMTYPPHQQESFHSIGQLDSTTWIKHDDARGATCYVYYYQPIPGREFSVGGISCIPDGQLR